MANGVTNPKPVMTTRLLVVSFNVTGQPLSKRLNPHEARVESILIISVNLINPLTAFSNLVNPNVAKAKDLLEPNYPLYHTAFLGDCLKDKKRAKRQERCGMIFFHWPYRL
jgi:hypothetical protein